MDEAKLQPEDFAESLEWDPKKSAELDDQTYEPGTALERLLDYADAEALQTFFVELFNHLSGGAGEAWQAYLGKVSEHARERQAAGEQLLAAEPLVYTESEARELANEAVREYLRGPQKALDAAQAEAVTEAPVVQTPPMETPPEESPQAEDQAEPTEPASPRLGELTMHTILEGERLESLAVQHYGDASLWRTIYNANREVLDGPNDPLTPGQELVIPSVKVEDVQGVEALTVHQVVSGDTLSALALKYYGHANLWPQIYAANREVIGDNPGRIAPGMALVIPRQGAITGPRTEVVPLPGRVEAPPERITPSAAGTTKPSDQGAPTDGGKTDELPAEPVEPSQEGPSAGADAKDHETGNGTLPESASEQVPEGGESQEKSPSKTDVSTGVGEQGISGLTEAELRELPRQIKAGEIQLTEVSTEALGWLAKNGPYEEFTPDLTVEVLKRCLQSWTSEDLSTFVVNVPVGVWSELLNKNVIPDMLRPVLEDYVRANQSDQNQARFAFSPLPTSDHKQLYDSDYLSEYTYPPFTFKSAVLGRQINFKFSKLPPDWETVLSQYQDDINNQVDKEIQKAYEAGEDPFEKIEDYQKDQAKYEAKLKADVEKMGKAYFSYTLRTEVIGENAQTLKNNLDILMDGIAHMPGDLFENMWSDIFGGKPETEIIVEMLDIKEKAQSSHPPQSGGFIKLFHLNVEEVSDTEMGDWYVAFPYHVLADELDDLPEKDAYVVRPEQQTETGFKQGQVVLLKDLLNGTYKKYAEKEFKGIESNAMVWIKLKDIDQDDDWFEHARLSGELRIPTYGALDEILSTKPNEYLSKGGRQAWDNYLQNDRQKNDSFTFGASEEYTPIRVPDATGGEWVNQWKEWKENDASGNLLTVRKLADNTLQYDYQKDTFDGPQTDDPTGRLIQYDYGSGQRIEMNSRWWEDRVSVKICAISDGRPIHEFFVGNPPVIDAQGGYHWKSIDAEDPLHWYEIVQNPSTHKLTYVKHENDEELEKTPHMHL